MAEQSDPHLECSPQCFFSSIFFLSSQELACLASGLDLLDFPLELFSLPQSGQRVTNHHTSLFYLYPLPRGGKETSLLIRIIRNSPGRHGCVMFFLCVNMDLPEAPREPCVYMHSFYSRRVTTCSVYSVQTLQKWSPYNFK